MHGCNQDLELGGVKKNHNETLNKHPFNINKLLTKLFLIRGKKNIANKEKDTKSLFLNTIQLFMKKEHKIF